MRWNDSEINPEQAPKSAMADSTKLLDDLRAELQTLLGSWEYAFAMGHGCTYGDHPQHSGVRQRAADLRARIAELTE